MIYNRIRILTGGAIILFLGGLLVNLQRIKPAPHLDNLGSSSMMDSLLAIALASIVLFLAAGLGSLLIKPFKLENWTFIERTVIGLPLGLAAIAYGVFFMGLAGWIKPIHLIGWLVIIAFISFKKSCTYLEEAFRNVMGIQKYLVRFLNHQESDIFNRGIGFTSGFIPGIYSTLGLRWAGLPFAGSTVVPGGWEDHSHPGKLVHLLSIHMGNVVYARNGIRQ